MNHYKHLYLSAVIEGKSTETVTPLVAYSNFCNRIKAISDKYPRYVAILESNNKYAIDELIRGYEPEDYLNFMTPNYALTNAVFEIFRRYKRNDIYTITLRIFFGYLERVYRQPEKGYLLYPVSTLQVSNISKFLNEKKNQDEPLNAIILKLLYHLMELDSHFITDAEAIEAGRVAGRTRLSYFDKNRGLNRYLTTPQMATSEDTEHIKPTHMYVGE